MDIFVQHNYDAMDTISLRKFVNKTDKGFIEVYVNGQPLHEILHPFYGVPGGILKNNTGTLGARQNKPMQILKLNQLMGKTISDNDIEAYKRSLPGTLTVNDVEDCIDKILEEMTNEDVLIYRCAGCGDYDCGGITVKISIRETSVVWHFDNYTTTLDLEFDKYSYLEVLKRYRATLQDSD